MRLNIDVATAAIILAQILGGAPMLQAAMAEGGRAQAGEPVLVGERGPEVFVPSVPGTVVPQYAEPDFGAVAPGQEWLARAQRQPTLSPNVEAWDRWLANAPESENIEDRRGPDATDMDENRWRRAHEAKKPLKQFPNVSTTPDWLKDQEMQWLRAKAKK